MKSTNHIIKHLARAGGLLAALAAASPALAVNYRFPAAFGDAEVWDDTWFIYRTNDPGIQQLGYMQVHPGDTLTLDAYWSAGDWTHQASLQARFRIDLYLDGVLVGSSTASRDVGMWDVDQSYWSRVGTPPTVTFARGPHQVKYVVAVSSATGHKTTQQWSFAVDAQ